VVRDIKQPVLADCDPVRIRRDGDGADQLFGGCVDHVNVVLPGPLIAFMAPLIVMLLWFGT
jgi:hypothetical protein